MRGLKNKYVLFHSVWGPGIWQGLAGSVGSGSFTRLSQGVSWSCSHLEVPLGRSLLPGTVVVGRIQFLMGCWTGCLNSSVAVDWRPCSVLYHVGLSIRQGTAWQLAFIRVSKKWSKRRWTRWKPESFVT